MGRTVRKWSGWALLILCGPFFKISFLTQAAMFLCILPIINLFDSIQNIQVTFQIVQSLRRVQLFVIPWTVASQAPLSMGILEARLLEWFAIPFSRGSSRPRDQTEVSRTAGRFFTISVTREAHLLKSLWTHTF